MCEETARNKIIEILKTNNWYAVKWDGHFDRYFVCLKLSQKSDKMNEIYGAIYESYDYLIGNDKEVVRFSIGYDCKSWKLILKKLRQNLKKIKLLTKIEKNDIIVS